MWTLLHLKMAIKKFAGLAFLKSFPASTDCSELKLQAMLALNSHAFRIKNCVCQTTWLWHGYMRFKFVRLTINDVKRHCIEWHLFHWFEQLSCHNSVFVRKHVFVVRFALAARGILWSWACINNTLNPHNRFGKTFAQKIINIT